MIETIGLNHRYPDGVHSVCDLDLAVDPGSIYCLFGANGAGKTTTIHVLLDFLKPSSGQARIHGIDCNRRPLEAKNYVAYVAESVQLYSNFTAGQNLAFFTRLAGRSLLRRDEACAALRSVGLAEEAYEQRLSSFSKGMRQKLGIAICILKDAPALVLDEPLSGLDPQAAHELVGTLKTLRDAGKAILMATHDIFRAKEMADRVGIMKQGRKVVEIARDELEECNLEDLYLAAMRENAAA